MLVWLDSLRLIITSRELVFIVSTFRPKTALCYKNAAGYVGGGVLLQVQVIHEIWSRKSRLSERSMKVKALDSKTVRSSLNIITQDFITLKSCHSGNYFIHRVHSCKFRLANMAKY